MNKEEFDINQELAHMRQDYADLKERFDKQQIVNEKLMEKAIHSDVRRLFLSKKLIPVGIALTVVAAVLCHIQGFAWWVTLTIVLFGLIFFPGIFWVYQGVREDEIYNSDILTTTGTLRNFKKRYISLEVGICIYFFAYVVAATIYMTSLTISPELMWKRGIIIALLCVGTLALEYISAKRLLKSCDDIIDRLQMKENDLK